ncbi:hypothetical protein [Tropicimonas isoalkanivorans]|uniref:hypothetical protein n=1 Tax=Tropicimonas isoalkanivorans TaxID=441112 RepID=UPI0015A52297|nr:hypothetical protein [Tropicimonas isoalkanivorans]
MRPSTRPALLIAALLLLSACAQPERTPPCACFQDGASTGRCDFEPLAPYRPEFQ